MPLTISMSAAQLLKKETFDAHTKAEKGLRLKLQSITTYDNYAMILKMFYGFFYPIENIISQYISPEISRAVNESRNTFSILIDLDSIRYSTGQLLFCHDLPVISSRLFKSRRIYV